MSRSTNSAQPTEPEGDASNDSRDDLDLERIRAAVRGIRYGEVRVIIQDGVIVQIERVERQRLR